MAPERGGGDAGETRDWMKPGWSQMVQVRCKSDGGGLNAGLRSECGFTGRGKLLKVSAGKSR